MNPDNSVPDALAVAEKFDLNAAYAPGSPDAKPSLLFKGGGMTTLYLNMPPGKGMPVHDHVGCQVTLVGMQGEANVVVAGQPHPLRQGELLTFSGAHLVEPRNDSDAPCGVLILLAETGA
ncbi:MAG: cupin domain-containing protein [Trueperaceae bacterium]